MIKKPIVMINASTIRIIAIMMEVISSAKIISNGKITDINKAICTGTWRLPLICMVAMRKNTRLITIAKIAMTMVLFIIFW